MRVILIENDKQIRELLPRYFIREGIEAVSAATGYEGLDAIYEGKPDIALLDVNLPDIDGWSVLRRIRQSESADMPVIMLTGRGELSDKLLGLEMGADDYIVKPFEPMEVVAQLEAAGVTYKPSYISEAQYKDILEGNQGINRAGLGIVGTMAGKSAPFGQNGKEAGTGYGNSFRSKR